MFNYIESTTGVLNKFWVMDPFKHIKYKMLK